jgi:hypothetical protein
MAWDRHHACSQDASLAAHVKNYFKSLTFSFLSIYRDFLETYDSRIVPITYRVTVTGVNGFVS